MATSLRKPPGLCEVCGVYVPLDVKRPNALHVCPGHRVVPRMPGSPARFDELVAKFKSKYLLRKDLGRGDDSDSPLNDEDSSELDTLYDDYEARYPLKRLKNWCKRVDNREAIEALATAARTVVAKYDSVIPADFLNAVRAQFIEPTLEGAEPCTCFVWHKTQKEWEQRFATLRLSKPAGEASGMTPFWDGAESIAKPAKLAGNFPPLNRSIEFPAPKLDTLVHEMIHWCTSPAYDQYSDTFQGNERALIREGTTEWLKCNAVGLFGAGGYKDVLPEIVDLLKEGVITEEQLIRAYLGGENVKATVEALVTGFNRKRQASMNAASIKGNEDERKLLKTQISERSYAVDKRSPEYRERVFKAFGGLNQSQRDSQVTNPRWRKYLSARVAGSDDAAALIAST